MTRAGNGRGLWGVAIAGGLGVTAGLLFLARVPEVPGNPGESPVVVEEGSIAPVGLARLEGETADAVLNEETMMRDPTPLFLPTRWSASADALPLNSWQEPGVSFRGYPPKLKFDEAELELQIPAVVALPVRPADAFALARPRRPFLGFGQTDVAVAPLPRRAAFIEVSGAADGQRMIAEALAQAQPPGDAAWQPLEFLLAVDARGVIGPPVLTQSSQVAAVDRYFQEHITDTLHLGERLGPGFYRVGIGP